MMRPRHAAATDPDPGEDAHSLPVRTSAARRRTEKISGSALRPSLLQP